MHRLNKIKTYATIIAIVILFTIGFFIGRASSSKIIVKYIKGDTIYDTTYVDKPYEVVRPAKPVLPLKPDTIKIPGQPEIIALKVDTEKIIENYIKENKYKIQLFDNKENGKLVIFPIVQYNELKKIVPYEFTPIQKVEEKQKERIIIPFVEIEGNSFKQIELGGGVFYHNVGISAKYITDFNVNGYGVSIKYKF